jgi:predicted enzyme related to lactoylglutathione lyase
MNESCSNNPVGWFEIHVNDMQRAKSFYEQVFGRPLTRLENPGQTPGMEMWSFPMLEKGIGITGALVKMPGVEPGRNSVIVYFMCGDCAVEAEKVWKAGGRIERPKFSIGQYGHVALVSDTEGNMIGLHSMQ